MNELLPSFQGDDADAADSSGAPDALQNGTLRGPQGPGIPMFPAVEELLALFKDSCKELVDLRQQVLIYGALVSYGRSWTCVNDLKYMRCFG